MAFIEFENPQDSGGKGDIFEDIKKKSIKKNIATIKLHKFSN